MAHGERRRAQFVVTSEAHVQNGYMPAGFGQVINSSLSQRSGVNCRPQIWCLDERTLRLIFNNYWCCEAGAG